MLHPARRTPVLLAALGLLLLAPAPASAEYRDLCDATKICQYTGPNAPVLEADVCLDAAGELRLKGSTPCAQGSWPFHVRHGELYDPLELLVLAYIPLKSACTVPGLCEMSDYAGQQETAQAICCVGAICWPGYDCGGTLMWCHDGVSNEDGTVTCFEGIGLDEV